MPEQRPSVKHSNNFTGWDINDVFYAILIELRKLNARKAGVDPVLIDDADADPAALVEIVESIAEDRHDHRADQAEAKGNPRPQRQRLRDTVDAVKAARGSRRNK